MIDKVAILRQVYERNRVRREARLPVLDIRGEFERAAEIAEQADYEAALAELNYLRPTLEAKWLVRQRRRRRDPHWYPSGLGGRYPLAGHVREVLIRILRMRTGRVEPDHEARDLVVYGSGRDRTTSDD
jgi:hypothetical protein